MAEPANPFDLDAEQILAGICRWVEIETPTSDPTAVNRLVDLVEAEFRNAGAAVERTPGTMGYGDILSATFPHPDAGRVPGIAVLSTSTRCTQWAPSRGTRYGARAIASTGPASTT